MVSVFLGVCEDTTPRTHITDTLTITELGWESYDTYVKSNNDAEQVGKRPFVWKECLNDFKNFSGFWPRSKILFVLFGQFKEFSREF